jgi:hypothetical protein
VANLSYCPALNYVRLDLQGCAWTACANAVRRVLTECSCRGVRFAEVVFGKDHGVLQPVVESALLQESGGEYQGLIEHCRVRISLAMRRAVCEMRHTRFIASRLCRIRSASSSHSPMIMLTQLFRSWANIHRSGLGAGMGISW